MDREGLRTIATTLEGHRYTSDYIQKKLYIYTNGYDNISRIILYIVLIRTNPMRSNPRYTRTRRFDRDVLRRVRVATFHNFSYRYIPTRKFTIFIWHVQTANSLAKINKKIEKNIIHNIHAF